MPKKRHSNGSKSNSMNWSNFCYVIRWYILLVKYIYACFTMTPLTANIIWRTPVIPVDSRQFEHKGADKANKRTRTFDTSFSMQTSVCPKFNIAILNSYVAQNNLHNLAWQIPPQIPDLNASDKVCMVHSMWPWPLISWNIDWHNTNSCFKFPFLRVEVLIL